MLKLKSKNGLTILEVMIALVIIVFIGWALIKVFQFASSFMSQSREKDTWVTLASRVNDALLDSRNYKTHSSQLSLSPSVLPSSISLVSRVSSTQEIKMGDLLNVGSSKTFFDSTLNPCNRVTKAPDCIYFVKVQWNASASAAPPNQVLMIDSDVGVEAYEKSERVYDSISFEIPRAFYTNTKTLKCPSNTPTKIHLGIRSYDVVNQTVDCWYIDTSKKCPAGQYANSMISNDALVSSDPRKDPNPASSEVHLECKPLYGVSCPEGYAPQKIFPIDFASTSMLDSACVSIFKDSIDVPRIGHIVTQVKQSQEGHPSNTGGYYGLKWLNGRPCPPKYKLKVKGGGPSDPVGDFRSIFQIHNSETKTSCAGSPICGDDNGSLFCDTCPISDTARLQGCNLRNFNPKPAHVGPNSGCNDPKIYDVNSDALDNFKSKYSCEMESTEKFKSGNGIILGAQSQ